MNLFTDTDSVCELTPRRGFHFDQGRLIWRISSWSSRIGYLLSMQIEWKKYNSPEEGEFNAILLKSWNSSQYWNIFSLYFFWDLFCNFWFTFQKPQVRYEILTLKISNDHYEWISKLQNLLQRMTSSQKLILFAEEEPINGILGLYHCIAIENPDRNIWFVGNFFSLKIHFFFVCGYYSTCFFL